MTTVPETIGDAPAPEEIRAAMERMVTSEVFSRSPQLGAFLRFVTEAVLHGKAERIKAYTIGVEVLRRDTQVRSAARSDRAGGGDATSPRDRALLHGSRRRRSGDRRSAARLLCADVPAARGRARSRDAGMGGYGALARQFAEADHGSPLLLLVAEIAIVTVLSLVLYSRSDRGLPPTASPARDVDGQQASALPRGNGMPTLQIEPLRVIGTPSPGAVMPERLYAKISDAFARFDTINVASGPVAAEPPASAFSRQLPARRHGRIRRRCRQRLVHPDQPRGRHGGLVAALRARAAVRGRRRGRHRHRADQFAAAILWRDPGARPRQPACVQRRRSPLPLRA